MGIDATVAEVVASVWSSQKASVDRSATGAGRSRGSSAKPYPVPWSIEPEGIDVPKRIAHIDELKPEAFVRFVEKYVRGSRLEASEKVDGSAMMLVWESDGCLWCRSKNGRPRPVSEGFPSSYAYVALAEAAKALATDESRLLAVWPDEPTAMSLEVLHTRRPNTIEYGPNALMMHGFYASGRVLTTEECLDLARGITGVPGGWRLEYRQLLPMSGVREDISELVAPAKSALACGDTMSFGRLRTEIVETMLRALPRVSPKFGAPGGPIEGIVFRDLDDGSLVKLVDRELFSELNRAMWRYREMLDRGTKESGLWKPGVLATFRSDLAEDVFGSRSLLAPSFAKKLTEGSTSGPVEALVERSIEDGLLSGDFIGRLRETVDGFKRSFLALSDSWDRARIAREPFVAKGRSFPMDEIVIGRTDAAFEHAGGLVAIAESLAMAVGNDRAGMRVAASLFLGGRKLVEALPAAVQKLKDRPFGARYYDTVEKNAEALGRRGIDVGQIKKLGSGTQGTAYLVGGNRVLKVTADRSEADATMRLIGKRSRHIVDVYDVFQFPNVPIFGILEERLAQLSQKERSELELPLAIMMRSNPRKKKWMDIVSALADDEWFMDRAYHDLIEAGVDRIVDELAQNGIGFADYNTSNLMRKPNGDIAVIDLGFSDVDPAKVPMLERLIGSALGAIVERRSDRIGMVVGRFQPFHRSHADMIRSLARNHDKVIVFVAGNGGGKSNPFSYELRRDMMDASLPDVEAKIEVYRADDGYVPALIERMIEGGSSAIKADSAVELMAGEDRAEEYRAQLERYAAGEPRFDTSLIAVILNKRIPDGQTDEVSGTKLRKMVNDDDRDGVGRMLDPHLLTDPTTFDRIYSRMRRELGAGDKVESMVSAIVGRLVEDTDDTDPSLIDVGEKGIWATLMLPENARKLKEKKRIDVRFLRKLGHGQMGVAFETEDGKVLKVTTDMPEAKAAWSLRGKSFEHIVRYFDAWWFEDVGFDSPRKDAKLYGIISEKLDPLSDVEKKEFDEFSEECNIEVDGKQPINDAIAGGDPTTVVTTYYKAKEIDVRHDLAYPVGQSNPTKSRKLEDILLKKTRWFVDTMKKYGVDEMIRDLRSAGISFTDYTAGNLMKRAGQYVINDLGKSRTNGAEPPRLERLVRDIGKSLVEDAGRVPPLAGPSVATTSIAGAPVTTNRMKLSDVGMQGIVDALMASADALKRKKGIAIGDLRRLGEGAMGVAFEMPDGRVLKVTTDFKEAKTAAHLVGKELRHVVRYFDVWRFRNVGKNIRNARLYGIVEEKLEELNDLEEYDMYVFAGLIRSDRSILDAVAAGDPDAALTRYLEGAEAEARAKMGYRETDELDAKQQHDLDEKLFKLSQRFSKTMREYEIDKMMRELRANGVSFVDYHAGNVMKRGGRYVINDLGLSQSPGVEPPFLERVVRSIVGSLPEVAMPAGPTTFVPPNARVHSSPWSTGSKVEPGPDDDEDRQSDLESPREKLAKPAP